MGRAEQLTEIRTWVRDIGLPAVLLFWILFRLDVALNNWLPAVVRTQQELHDIHTTIRRCCPPGSCPPCEQQKGNVPCVPESWPSRLQRCSVSPSLGVDRSIRFLWPVVSYVR